MIEKMLKFEFIMMSSDKDSFLEKMSGLGVADIKRSSLPVDEKTGALLDEINALRKELSELEKGSDGHLLELIQRREELVKACDNARIWGDFDRNVLEELGRNGATPRFYQVKKKDFDPAWEEQYPMAVISEDKSGERIIVTFGTNDFPGKEIQAPSLTITEARSQLDDCLNQIEDYRRTLVQRKDDIPTLREKIAGLSLELDRQIAAHSGSEAAEGRLCIFECFVPAGCKELVLDEMESFGAVILHQDATVEDDPPIKLRNNRFVSMFQVFTDMYGRPVYDGFDPTPFISVFFLLFFAFCMGDAGYGLILIGAGALMRKSSGLGKFSPLVMTLGAATAVIGFIFHTFFSCDISTWEIFRDSPVSKCFLPSKIMGYDGTMVLSLIVGIVHICLALAVKTFVATKSKGFLNSLGIWGWTLLIVGGTVIGLFCLIGVLDKEITKIVIIIIGILSALGIFLLNDLHRNPLKNIGAGLWETYNTATGLLGDVLSYLRLYALGLAGSMLGMAFNSIGKMVAGDGSSALLWIAAALIIVFGQVLNIAMSALGAFVHPLRLNFLEFFKNSGYDGSGRNYNPLK